jgi:hypothetical protein
MLRATTMGLVAGSISVLTATLGTKFILSSSTYWAGTNLWTPTKRFCELDIGLVRGHVEILQARELTLQPLPSLGVGDIVGQPASTLLVNSSTQRASSSGVRVAIRSSDCELLMFCVVLFLNLGDGCRFMESVAKFLRATWRERLHARKRATLRATRKGVEPRLALHKWG